MSVLIKILIPLPRLSPRLPGSFNKTKKINSTGKFYN